MRSAMTFAAILAAFGYVTQVHAQAAAPANISVDGTAAGTTLERIWPFYGYDESNYTTTPSGMALLRTLAGIHPDPVHVRTHFLLNTGNGIPSLKWSSTNAYTEDAAGNPVYSWTLLDGIMDAITGAGTFPYVEIAFMPQALSVHPDPYQNTSTYELDSGSFYPPRDYAKWGALIQAWAAHSRDRYPGLESTWQWELWNEPDIGYWRGTFAEYARLYDFTESALHQVIPNAPLGGPAVASAQGTFLPQFLQHCATGVNAVTGRTGTRLDIVSFHAKGGAMIVGGHVEMNLGHQLVLHRDGFNAIAAFPMFRQTPIVVSEADPDGCAACPVSTTPADAYRNSPAYGAYEVAMMKRSLELEARTGVKLEALLTWAFLFPGQPYFAGFRTLQTNGIDLPVLNAFKLLGALSGTRLPLTSSGARTLDDILANSVRTQPDIDAMATRNGSQIQVLVWNYHDDLVATAPSPVHLSVNVPSSFGASATMTHVRADETHGDAYTVWVSQGSPASPTSVQLADLQRSMQPTALEPTRTVAITGGALMVDFDLPRFGISLLTFVPTMSIPDASMADGAVDAAGSDAVSRADAEEPMTPRDAAPPPGEGGTGGAGGGTGMGGARPPTGGGSGTSSPGGGAGAEGSPSSTPSMAGSRGCSCEVAGSRAPGWAWFGLAVPLFYRAGRRRRPRQRSR